MEFETDFTDTYRASDIISFNNYLKKLDFVSDRDIVDAFRLGNVEIPPLDDETRVNGITYLSLDTLTSEDWCDFIVDRLLTGINSKFRPCHTSRDEYRTAFFGRLIVGNGCSRPELPVGDTFVQRLVEGYKSTIPLFVNETIPILKLPRSQNYDDARKDLFFMASLELGTVVEPLEKYEFVPRETDEERTCFFPIIDKILTEHLPKLKYWRTGD
ncbi:hypothetical protein GOV12_05520 [Candidatus Pacearchaeota archaeon]|nr:hypothetical protein [Candidatus Pacearchaeota archaeon]